jgi:glycosyltransferase involved in cell wall biosynthesis
MARQWQAELAECGVVACANVDLRNYDVALVNGMTNAPKVELLTQKFPGMPVVLWVHEGISVLRNSKESISSWVKRFSACRLVIYQTEWQRDSVFKSLTILLPDDRLVVVPNGIEPVLTPPRADVQEGTFKIVCVGSVYGRKRPLDLARVVCRLAEEFAVECAFIGDLTHAESMGPAFGQMRDPSVSSLKWMGAMPHPQALEHVSRADLLCLPSEDESFALTPLEAAARGVPVALSALAPYAYIGWRDEVNCLQHRVGDLAHLEAQIRRLMTQPALRERLRVAGKELADRYTIDRFLRAFTDSVQSVVVKSG